LGASSDVGTRGRRDEAVSDRGPCLAHVWLRRASNAKATEAYSKYIITDMYAKAVQDAAGRGGRVAEAELRKIYEA